LLLIAAPADFHPLEVGDCRPADAGDAGVCLASVSLDLVTVVGAVDVDVGVCFVSLVSVAGGGEEVVVVVLVVLEALLPLPWTLSRRFCR
jgi:hypothetical protein